MSVPQWKQTASQLDAYNEAVKLRHIVTEMIMRDFGLKLPERQYEIHIGQQLRNRYPELADLFNKFDKIQDETTRQELLTQYPKWMIDNRRQKLDEYTADREKGIELNEKKTRITKLSQGFRFLKVRFVLTDTGKVIKRPDHKTWKRERVKLKKLKRLLDEGKISFEDVRQSYNSWRGYVSQMSTYQSVRNMDRLFNELFIKDWRNNNHGNKEKRYRDRCIKYNYPNRKPPACRRYCTELPTEWKYIRIGHGD